MSEQAPRRCRPARRPTLQRRCVPVGIVILTVVAGCQAPPRPSIDATHASVLAVLLPSAIKIVEPFTIMDSAEGKAKRDWVELWLQAQNVLGSPGLMIAGKLRVELSEHLPARGNAKGPRLEHWNIDLATIADQRKYWNAVTQMYEFRLGYDRDRIPKADKYVLTVIYQPPIGARLADEITLTRNQSETPR